MKKVRLKAGWKEPLQIACCLVFNEDGKLLLVRRHSEDLGGGRWATPGGRQEKNEDFAETAVREVKEETDLILNQVTLLGIHELRMPHGVVHMRTFRGEVNNDQVVKLDFDELEEYRWVNPNEVVLAQDIIWGLPTTLKDFKIVAEFDIDLSLADGSDAILLELV